MKSSWPTRKLGDKNYFEILGSGIDKFEGKKDYLSTSSIEGNKVIKIEEKITYYNRPSRANMRPRLNSVWFARMMNTVKVYSFTEENKEEINKYVLSTGFAGILCNPEKVLPKYIEKIFLSKWFNSLKDVLASNKAIQKSLNNDDIEDLKIPLPPLSIQQKIVSILDTIQEVIEVQEKIIEKTKELKKSLMADLFKYGAPSFRRGRKLKKTEIGEIPEDWGVVNFLNALNRSTKFKVGELREENYQKLGKFPIVDQSEEKIVGYSDNKDLLYQGALPVIIFGDHTRVIKFVDFPFIVGGSGVKIIMPIIDFDINYFYYFLSALNIESRGYNRHFGILKEKLILKPSLTEQREIAGILQMIDEKIEIEKKKKELYEELFKTMLNKLMNQEIDVENLQI